jgi:hypothetical protein
MIGLLVVAGLAGCDANGAGVRTTNDAPDAAPDLVAVVAAVDSTPDAGTGYDLVQAPDMTPAPDSAPARQPDAWQAPSIDLGTDTLPSVDGGSVDVLAATPDAPSCPAGQYLIHYSGLTYCEAYQDAGMSDALSLPDTLAVAPDTIPALPKCDGPDSSFCSIRLTPIETLCDSGKMVKVDGGGEAFSRKLCAALCGLCTP